MQKKLLVTLISSAFAGVAGVANAGPISVASVGTYAVEAMGTNVAVSVGNIAYTLTSPFAAVSIQSLKYKLDSSLGVVGNCPAVALSPAVAGVVIGGAVLSTDKLSCSYSVTVGATPVPASQTISFTNAKVASSAALATTGGKINGTVEVLDNGGNLVESNTAVVAQSAHAFTLTVTSSADLTTAERSRVDITTTPTPGVKFTTETDATPGNATTINLGRIRYTEAAGVQLAANGVTEVNFVNATIEDLTTTVAGTFSTATGTSLFLSTKADCSVVLGAAITPIASATSNKFTQSVDGVAADADGNKDVFICYTVPGTKVIPTAQFTADASVDQGIAAANDLTDETVAVTNIYNLRLNGVQIDVRNHIPSSITGWTNAYRIINTGAVAASFSAQYIGVDGVPAGSAQVIAASLPAGGTVVVSVPAIEGVLGAAPAGAPAGVGPRLRITAPTDSARVMVYGVQPNGAIFTNSDAQGADNGGTDK